MDGSTKQLAERFLTEFFENAVVAFFCVSPDGTVVHANAAYLDLVGHRRDDYIHRPIAEFLADDDMAREFMQRIESREELRCFEARLRRRDGSFRDVLIDSNFVVDGDRIVHARCFTRDVTEQKRAERALRETEERFARFMQHLPGLAWIKDSQGRYIYANEAAEKAFRTPRERLYGLTDDDVFPPETAAKFKENDRRAIECGGVRTIETLPADDGKLRHSIVHKFTIPDASGALVGGMAIDITDRLQFEEELRRSEARLEAVLSSIGDHVVTYDRQWRYVYVNGKAAEVLGKTREELLGKSIWDLFPDAVGNEYYQCLHRAVETGEVVRMEHYYPPFGRWFENHIYPMADGVTVFAADITARKKLEQDLQRAETRLRLAQEEARVGMWDWDHSTNEIYWSEGIWRLLGEAPDEKGPSPDRFERRMHPEDRKEGWRRFRRAFENKLPSYTSEFRLYQLTGEERWISACSQIIWSATGELERQVGVCIDITDRKRIEQQLREREHWLSTVMDAAPALAYLDTGLRFKFVNRPFEEKFGVPADHIVGRTVIDVCGPELFEQRRPYLEKALRGETVSFEARACFGNGQLHETALRYTPHFSHAGELQGILVLIEDISDRKRVEEELRKSEALYRAIGESINYGVWVCDPQGRNVYTSESFLKLVGLTQQECSAFGWSSVLHPDEAEATVAAWRECVEKGESWEREHRFRGVDGKWHYVLARGAPIRDDSGRIVCWAGINLDVDTMKQAEASLKEADRRKDEFLATLAHELRNPLAPIRNAVQLLQIAGAEDDELQWSKEVIVRQVDHLTRLIDDLLDISRITRNKLELRKERVELADVIRSAVETSRPLIEECRHELSITLPGRPVFLEADPLRLAQVFLNLLNNAAKYTDRGGRIALSAFVDHNHVSVSVADNGIGVAPEHLPRLFEMFSQLAPALDRTQGGLGIGLALVRGLTEMHGGTVEARSKGIGHGTEFIVRLPILEPAQPKLASPPAGNRNAARNRRRILVVDDNRDAADTLALMFKAIGHEVHTAYDGLEAVEEAERFRPEVAFLDIGMPKLNGHDAARRIRATDWGASILLIALTGWGQEEDRLRTREAGFNHHLVKPITLDRVQQILEGLLAS